MKLDDKYEALLDKADAKYSVIDRFNASHKMNLVLFGITLVIFARIMSLGTTLKFLKYALLTFASTICLSGVFAFKFVQPLLIRIEYNGKERHIFSRNIALQKLLITSVVAFVAGVLHVVSDFFDLPTKSTQYVFLKLISVWLGCIAGIQQCMLEHARNVWVANRNRNSKTQDGTCQNK